MLEADRGDLLQLVGDKELRINHDGGATREFHPSGTIIPIEQNAATGTVDERTDRSTIRQIKRRHAQVFAKGLGTRSLLVIPIMLSGDVLGLLVCTIS